MQEVKEHLKKKRNKCHRKLTQKVMLLLLKPDVLYFLYYSFCFNLRNFKKMKIKLFKKN